MAGRGVDDRPSSSGSRDLPGWPSIPSTSRGVAHRFRNFRITNDHPEGIVYCQPNNMEDSEASSNAAPDGHDLPPSSQPGNISASMQPRRPSSSSSSSIVSCSPTTSPILLSPCLSNVSDNGTVIVSTSSSEHDFDEYYSDEDVTSSKNLKKNDNAPEEKELQNNSTGKVQEASASNSAKEETLTGKETKSSTDGITNDDDNNLNEVPPPLLGQQPPLVVDEDNDIPQFVHHKKFNYKQVQAAAAAAKSVSLGSTSVIKHTGKTATVSGTIKKPVGKELTVDNLKLSPYITREQAATRLKALGNLEETQKEIDDFAAIICTSEMFRMQLQRNKNEPIGGGGEHPPLFTQSSSSSHVKNRNQAFHHHDVVEQQTIQAGMSVTAHSSFSRRNERPRSDVDQVVYGNTGIDAGGGGGAEGAYSKFVGEVDNVEESPPENQNIAGGGGYFQITSPGQTSNGDENYEWISDADE